MAEAATTPQIQSCEVKYCHNPQKMAINAKKNKNQISLSIVKA